MATQWALTWWIMQSPRGKHTAQVRRIPPVVDFELPDGFPNGQHEKMFSDRACCLMDAGHPVEVKPSCKMSQRCTVQLQGCKQQHGIMIFLHLWTKANRPTEAFPQWPALARPVHRRGDRAPHSRFTGRCRVLSSALNCIMVLNLR